MTDKLATLTNILSSGIFPGFPERAVPFWTDGRNVRFRRGAVEKSKGYGELLSAGVGTISALAQRKTTAGKKRIFFTDSTKIYKFDEGDTVHSTIGTSLSSGDWSFVIWGDWLLGVNNTTDGLQVWQGSGVFSAPYTTPFTSAKILIKRSTHVLALNTSTGPDYIEWCSSDDVSDWTPVAANSAGNLQLRELDGEIIAASIIGDAIAVYSNDTMQVVNYVGSPFYFGQRPAIQGIGAVGKNVIVAVGRENFGLSWSGFFKTDGVASGYIGEAVKDYFEDNVNKDALKNIVSYHNEDKFEVVWCVPTGTSTTPTQSFVYNYVTNSWTILDYAYEAVLDRQVFSFPVGALGGNLLQVESGQDKGLTAQHSYVQSKGLDLSTEQRDFSGHFKYIDAIVFSLDAGSEFDFYLGIKYPDETSISWEGPFAISDTNNVIYPRSTGWLIYFKIDSNTLGEEFAVNAIEVFGEIAGRIV